MPGVGSNVLEKMVTEKWLLRKPTRLSLTVQWTKQPHPAFAQIPRISPSASVSKVEQHSFDAAPLRRPSKQPSKFVRHTTRGLPPM